MAAGLLPSRAVERPAPAGGIPLVAGARLPLGFIGLGLAALAGAATWLAYDPALLLLPHVHPRVAALAHAWLPGFLLSVCFGAVYQLMPVVLGAPLRLPLAAAWAHLALHAAGVGALLMGFTAGRFEWVALGGGAIVAGVGLFAAGTIRTFTASTRRDAIAWSFPLAAGWLAATVAAGLVLALNRRAAFLPWSVVALMHAHAHLGLVGFFLTLLQGATFQLVPMFTMAELRRPRCVGVGLGLAQAGLLVLVPSLAGESRPGLAIGALAVAAGIACSGVALAATLAARRRRVLETGMRAFVGGATVAGAVTLFGVGLAWRTTAAEAGAVIYGGIAIAGALSLMVLGMLCKIVPFLVWMRAYGPQAGRRPVPLATALGSKPIERAWLGAHGSGLATLVAGIAVVAPWLVRAGALLLFCAVLLFLANMAGIVAHLVRPRFGAVPRPLVASV